MQKSRKCSWVAVVLAVFLVTAGIGSAALRPGQNAPVFTLQDMQGKAHSLSTAKANRMTVLFFFDAASRPSQEALMMLDQLSRQYKGAGLAVWAITRSDAKAVQAFISHAKPRFPILKDTTDVSRQYDAHLILPVVCTLDPQLQIIDYHQGGGKTIEIMMVDLAQRQLHRRETQLAKAISDKVVARDPQNVQARSVKGYAALKEGNLDQAAKIFDQLAQDKGKAQIVGKEGQAAVLAQKGQSDQALKLVAEIESKAPNRAYTEMIKGDILAQKGETAAAGKAYQKAVASPVAQPFQKAEAYNRLGQYQAHKGAFAQANKMYDQAVALDPYYIEPTSNKGVAYEKQGKWQEALAQYRKTLELNANDAIAVVLARKAEEMMALQKDQQRKGRIDKLVKELAQRYRQQQAAPAKQEDSWTSRPMVLSLVDFTEKGGIATRDGLASALATQLGELLNASGRVRVVERALIERLLEELNIGSSELADPQTALRLGRILAARVIGTGSIFYLPRTTMLNLRLIDTETTVVDKSFTASIGQHKALDRQLYDLNRDILRTIIQTYPLRGYVVQTQGKEVLLNLGANQGMVKGTRLNVIEDAAPIVYKGRTLQGAPKIIAEIEVERVEPDLSHARIISKQRELHTDDKVEENIKQAAVR